jgi:myo-inositol-1(or 4)-monophosphatase
MVSVEHSGLKDLTGFAMEVIHEVGHRALEYYGKGHPQIKFDEDLVTEAELNLTEFFKRKLMDHYPEHLLFKDLLESSEYSHEGKRYVWVFDPLDGVANFQAGIPIWGSSLALIENFWPIFGVFLMPATGDLFHAQAGENAFWGKEKIQIPEIEDLNDESLLLTYSRFHHHFKSTFPGKVRALGCTGAHICYVAMGRADAAVVANESFQDLAAARVIIEAAGGKICRMDGRDFHLNEYLNGRRIDGYLLVTAPAKLTAVRRYLQKLA